MSYRPSAPSRHPAWTAPTLAALALAVLVVPGCGRARERVKFGPTLEGQTDRLDLLDIPTIHSIGESTILTYEPGRPLEIKILGNDLNDPDLSWNISINGIAPLLAGEDYVLRRNTKAVAAIKFKEFSEDPLAVVLKADYINRVRSGDPLRITIQVANNRLARRYLGVNDNVKAIEEKIAQLTLLRSDIQDWILEAQAAEAKNPGTKGTAANPLKIGESALASLRLRLSRAIQPISAELSAIHEATVDGRDNLTQVLADLRQIDLGAPDFTQQFERTEQHLVKLRSIFKDFLRTNVSVSPIVASASRHFLLISAEDYRRRFLGSVVPLNELSAFPLPDEQARRIFGPVVAEQFFVVTLSISNFSGQDRLIDTGMIKASGRALICPPSDASLGGPVFNYTVPIEVVPQSVEQVYTLVSDTKAGQSREWVFRSLEFAGALATATVVAFKPEVDLIKGMAMFAGVVLPGAKALWPDDVPGYQRNIIAFGMPDLVKINGKSTVGHKVLFFSKEKLQLMVSDPMQFGFRKGNEVHHPEQYVIQLAFDSLMVTFDNITTPVRPGDPTPATVTTPAIPTAAPARTPGP